MIPIHFSRLPDIPVKEGLAGLFGGVSHGKLLIAGGSNFPGKKVWEGGTKVWYPDIYALDSPHSHWKRIGSLPGRLGYGVSVSYRNRVICVGGSDKDRHHAEVFSLEFKAGHIVTRKMSSLPIPLSLHFGARVGRELVVGGGEERPDSKVASSRFFALNLSNKNAVWKEIPGLPGSSRIFADAVGTKNTLWVAGGASLANGKRTYLKDAYRFDFRHGWKQLKDLLQPSLGAPILSRTNGELSVLGGDDGLNVGFKPPEKHPGFSHQVQTFNPRTNQWTLQKKEPFAAVLMPLVEWHHMWILTGGEIRPGVRTAHVFGVRR